MVLKFGRRLMVFILDFSIGCPNIVCQCPPGILWKFGVCWLTIWLLLMWVSLFLWGVFGVYCGLLSFSIWGSLWFSDVFKSLDWMWGVCWMCTGSGTEWSLGVVWVWAWEVLVSWWSGVASSSTCVPSYNNSNSSFVRDQGKIRLLKKERILECFLWHLSFWVSGVESPLFFFKLKKK